MKTTVNASIMKAMFKNYDRDYYSFSGLETLLEYYDEIDENIEFDPIGICCECSEYGDRNICALSFDDFVSNYGYLYPVNEWLDDNALTENEFNSDLYLDSLIERLEENTTVLRVPNGNIIVFMF